MKFWMNNPYGKALIMNPICKKYYSQIKHLFPILSKPERDYLKKMKLTLIDFCEQDEPDSIKILYEEFGYPQDIIHNYFRSTDKKYISKRIRKARLLRFFITFMLCILLAFAIVYRVNSYYVYQSYEADLRHFEQEGIEFDESTLE